jgi:hypothetical protein
MMHSADGAFLPVDIVSSREASTLSMFGNARRNLRGNCRTADADLGASG